MRYLPMRTRFLKSIIKVSGIIGVNLICLSDNTPNFAVMDWLKRPL